MTTMTKKTAKKDPQTPALLKRLRAERADLREDAREGYIYVIDHPTQDGWVTIGSTRDCEHTLRSFNQGQPDVDYRLRAAFHFPVCDSALIEAHRLLCMKFVAKKLWFAASPEATASIIGSVPGARRIQAVTQ
jgi:hypothetical protein